ncbi:UNVERIFIED_CONTAM: hypothetical protein NCL1_23236 [Trichonephila clavipes]
MTDQNLLILLSYHECASFNNPITKIVSRESLSIKQYVKVSHIETLATLGGFRRTTTLSGHGILMVKATDSWQVCHEFEPVPQKTCRVE